MRRAFKRNLALAGMLAVLCGCSITQPAVKVDYYELSYASPVVENVAAMDVVIGVRRFGIAAAYDHDRMVEREKGFKTTPSYYHRWANNPRMMLSDLLLRDLRASGGYKAVVIMPANVLPDYEVDGFIQEILLDRSGPVPMVLISMEVTLLRSKERIEQTRIVFQKSFLVQVPCKDQAASGIASAMSDAFKDISTRVQKETYEAIRSAGK